MSPHSQNYTGRCFPSSSLSVTSSSDVQQRGSCFDELNGVPFFGDFSRHVAAMSEGTAWTIRRYHQAARGNFITEGVATTGLYGVSMIKEFCY
jgi:hypothetical protein